MGAVAADGLIRLPPKVNAMSTAPPFGSRTGHDWLMVGTAGAATRNAAREPATPWRPWSSTATAALATLRDRCAEILHSARAASEEAATALLRAMRERSVPIPLPAVGAISRRIGNRLRPSWDWRRVSNFALLRAHPVAATLGSVLLLVLGYIAYCTATIPSDGGLVIAPTPSALVVEADGGQVFATRGVFKGDKLAPQDVPHALAQAIIAIEDRHFYEHTGFYLPSLMRAAFRNFVAGSTREGGSTISQQLARMAYLSQERTIRRKIQEAILTFWIEHRFTKQEILTNYLNTAYFGAGVYGVDAAAKRYFGKAATGLSLSESAMLAGLVLDAMVETGAISRAQADAARAQPAALRVPPDNPPGTNYFVDMLNADVKRLVGPVSEDLTLRSTLDLTLQSIAEAIISRRLKAEGRAKKVTQAALVAMAPDGAILAMVGGRDYNESQFNRVTQAKRQPGSLFKLFVYLTAFQHGLTPQMTMVDRPVQIGNWEPENYGGGFRGQITLRTAFANSVNSVAVQLAEAVGIPSVIDTARKLGVQSELPAVPSLALGSGEVTLLEMTRAFAAIAANAESVEPYAIRAVRKGDQALFTRPRSELQPASDPGARAAIRDVLTSVVRDGTGRAARINGPVAGKTGTSQSYRDEWFIGFSSGIVVGVWVGNDDNSPTRGVTGGDIPARIWNEFVTQSATARAKPARPQTISLGASEGANVKPGTSASIVRGVPVVQNTGTLQLQGRVIRLFGVEGARGRAARDLRRYLGRREVVCEPAGSGNEYRCSVDDQDLSRVVLFNGGGRASANATPEMRALDQQARSIKLGIWRAGDGDDD